MLGLILVHAAQLDERKRPAVTPDPRLTKKHPALGLEANQRRKHGHQRGRDQQPHQREDDVATTFGGAQRDVTAAGRSRPSVAVSVQGAKRILARGRPVQVHRDSRVAHRDHLACTAPTMSMPVPMPVSLGALDFSRKARTGKARGPEGWMLPFMPT
jgi:hypothetical protein